MSWKFDIRPLPELAAPLVQQDRRIRLLDRRHQSWLSRQLISPCGKGPSAGLPISIPTGHQIGDAI